MRILYAVQRYGEQVVGGSESAARMFAERLAQQGHDVEVVTSCATSYVDWANVLDSGTEDLNGVTVHRLPVLDLRRPEKFGPLHGWMIAGPRPAPLFEQQRWAKHMGPDLAGYRQWLRDHHRRFDLAVFMTYLYATATVGLPVVAGQLPTILQPTAHDEPPLRVPLYDSLFRQPDAFLYFTPEEQDIVRSRFNIETPGRTIGIGIDLEEATDVNHLLGRYCLADCPYLLYVGRIDTVKGSSEAFHFFREYKRRNPGPLKFVLVGERVSDIPDDPDVVYTGFLDEADKRRALAGALAMVQPSRFESFSIVLCESWVQRRPALVHRDSAVLLGQARRSGGAVPYSGFAEFEAAVDLLVNNRHLTDAMGENGRRYVEAEYRWDTVLAGFEDTASLAIRRFADRCTRPLPHVTPAE